MRFDKKSSIALVLSGGGIKAAAFHIGVCLALEERGFKFQGGLKSDVKDEPLPPQSINMYVGSSAGAMISTILAAGHSVDDLIHAFEMGIKKKPSEPTRLKALTYWDIFALNSPGFLRAIPSKFRTKSLVTGGFESFLKNGFKLNGLFSTRGLEKYLKNQVLPTNDFSELSSQLFIVATALNSSRKAVFGPHDKSKFESTQMKLNFANISEAAAASMSLPPVYCPYGLKNERGEMIYFFDGEIRDTLSTHVAADNGADLILASYSIQPYQFNDKMGSLHEYGIPLILNQALYQVVEQKILKNMEHMDIIASIYTSIDKYFKENNLPDEDRKKLLEVIAKKANYRPKTEYIYIHPNPQDYEMFFVDHFSLNKEILERIVKIGFKSALKVLRRYDS